jgi:hypothetical protein
VFHYQPREHAVGPNQAWQVFIAIMRRTPYRTSFDKMPSSARIRSKQLLTPRVQCPPAFVRGLPESDSPVANQVSEIHSSHFCHPSALEACELLVR